MDLIDLLADLVRINSINPEWGGPGEREMAIRVKTFFEEHRIEVEEHEVLPGRPNILAHVPGRDPSRRIILEAHMDTVGASGMAIDPFEPEVRDGRLYGRGSVDVKAGLAAMMQAVAHLEDPPCDVWMAAVIDEEQAFRGVLDLIRRIPEADAAIVAEPTGNRIVTATKGVLRWRIHTRGTAAHSSKPHLGHNAVNEMARVLIALEDFESTREVEPHSLLGPPTLSVGTIAGGTQVNIVPDRCTINLDRRLLPGETVEGVLAAYEEVCRPFDCEFETPYLADEAMETDGESKVVWQAAQVSERLGLETGVIGVPFGCDASKLSRTGIPSIVFGPGSIDQAHADVEFVELDQVRTAARFYEAFCQSFEGIGDF